MKRKLVGVALFCILLFGAILAGYWDMINAEKTRIAAGETVETAAQPSAVAPETGTAATSADAASPAAGEAATSPAPATAPPGATQAEAEAATETKAEAEAAQATPAPDAAASPAAPSATATPNPSETAALPTFDILRVEPDGSTVLAGKAPAGSTVSLDDGKGTIGSETANDEGEFVIVLDKPLPVGDHQIRIGAKTADGQEVVSEETAIVSVPTPGREGELLAMVEKPDEASRLISIPQAPDAANVPSETTAGGDVLLPGTAATNAEAAATAIAPPATPAPAATASATIPAAARALVNPALVVEAVEIEGDSVYIAGRAAGLATVRAYIDDVPLGEPGAVTDDRFLVTAKAPVAPGEHTVRADALDASGTVVARVEVPFSRPETGDVSATESAEAPSAPAATGAGGTAAGPGEDGTSVTAGSASPPPSDPAATASSATTSPAMTSDTAAAAAPQVASGTPAASGDPAAARSDTDAGTSTDTATAGAEAPASSPAPAAAAEATPQTMATAPGSPGAPGANGDLVAIPATEAPAEADTAAGSSAAADASSASPATEAPTDPARFGAPAGETTIAVTRQPALETVASRVIIRRGDTLWRISRSTYGRGARYTVIYLANGDQIRDPNRIYPGQVFRMPKNETNGASAVQ